MAAFLAPLRDPLTAFIGGIGGAALAWLWFANRPWIALGILVVPLVFAGFVPLLVTPKLIHAHPGRAVGLYNCLTWVYVALTAVVAAVSIILVLRFAWVDKLTDEKTKQMLSALTAALTTFIGSILVTTDETDTTIGAMVEKRFVAAFNQAGENEIPEGSRYIERTGDKAWYLPMGSLGIRAANEDYAYATGWGRAARRRRAHDIETYLRPPRQ